MIDILVPVLGRSANAEPLVESIIGGTTVDYSILFLCSLGDEEQIMACKQTGARVIIEDFGEHHQYPRKMNRGFAKTDREFVLLAADDLDFQAGWDTEAMAVASETGAGVIGTNDCANPSVMRGDFSTHPLVRRSYVVENGGTLDGPGVLLHEGYDHNSCDVELAKVAQFRDQWAFAADSRICHRHPGWGTADEDATYLKGRATFSQDRRLYQRRSRAWSTRRRR